MATSKRTSAGTEGTPAVDDFMARLDHPHKLLIEAIRRAVRNADPAIVEGIKWSAPSFRRAEYFATTHLRAKAGVGVILHLGAKVREGSAAAIDDPDGLLQWLAKDRAMISFASFDASRRSVRRSSASFASGSGSCDRAGPSMRADRARRLPAASRYSRTRARSRS